MESSIRSLSLEELEGIITGYGQPKYRAKQVYEWLHKHNVSSYDEMQNIPKALRAKLAADFQIVPNKLIEKVQSEDDSRKYLIELSDGAVIESVGIVGNDQSRLTVCVSSQVGCAMECEFCATGQQGFTRNLSSDEIVDQVVIVGKDFDKRVDNVVLMGQGEPFNNYDNVISAIRRMNNDDDLNIGARHITVSTSGIIDEIYSFAHEPEQFRLAVSLHSADQSTRNQLMPRLSGQPLRKLRQALKYYNEIKGRRVTIEYMLLDGINDSEGSLDKLLEFCKDFNAHLNLLTFNSITNSKLSSSKKNVFNKWQNVLQSNGIPTSIRFSKGSDVNGACGQLKSSQEIYSQ